MKIERRTILITGGTSGIGLEFARQLMARGNTVIITGRDPVKLAKASQAVPGIHAICTDVSDPAAIEVLYTDMVARFPALDIIINNAGMMRNLKLQQARPLADLTSEIEVGFKGPVWMVQQFLPHLQKQNNAIIVNVSSGLAFVPFPAAPIYCAAKAALHAYTLCLRAQLAGTNVTVIELAPPGTETPLFRAEFAEEMKREKGMKPDLLVRRAIAGIEAGKPEIRPGLANVLMIASRVAPSFMFKQMIKLSQLQLKAA